MTTTPSRKSKEPWFLEFSSACKRSERSERSAVTDTSHDTTGHSTNGSNNTNGAPAHLPRKGAHFGPVSELSVFLKVKPGHEQLIREVFNSTPEERAFMAKAIHDVGSLHQARYVLFDNGTRLLIATAFDGDWDVYIGDFARTYILDAWDKFLIHCEGYPDEGKAVLTVDQIKDFLTEKQVTAVDFMMVYPGVTSKQIQKALRVESAFQQVLDTPGAAEALQQPALKPLAELAVE